MNYDELVQQVLIKGGWDEANDYLDNYINENPDNFDAYLVRSEFLTEMEDFENALIDAEKAIKICPSEARAYNNRGCIYIKSGNDIKKGLNDFNKALDLDANFISAYTNRANVYLKMREPQKAINDCTKAIEISPNKDSEPYYNRGLAYMNIGETEKAFDDYNKVIELDPENAEAYGKRGVINSQLGNIQDAISDFEEFLRLDPDNKLAEMVRDELRQLKGKKTERKQDRGLWQAIKTVYSTCWRGINTIFKDSSINFLIKAIFVLTPFVHAICLGLAVIICIVWAIKK